MRGVKLAVCVSVLFAIQACQTDSYDKGEGQYSYTQADFVEAHANDSRAVDRVTTDDGDILTLTPQPTASWITTADSTYRALLYYNKKSDGHAQPVAISRVPVMTVVPAHESKETKTDPVTFESMWKSRSGKYLTMGLYLKVGQAADDQAHHSLGMVCDSVVIGSDGGKTSYVRLLHNQGGVPEYYSAKYFVSVPVDAFETDSVVMTVNTYGGVVKVGLGL